MTEKEIAEELHISAHTVHTHVERLYHKLHVGCRSDLLLRIFRAYVAIEFDGKCPDGPARADGAAPPAPPTRTGEIPAK